MKTFTAFLLIVSMAASAASGAFKLPSSVYRMNELEQAKAEALAKGKPIAFLFTDENTSCCLSTDASQRMASELKTKAVLVYYPGPGAVKLPPAALSALSSPEAGMYIPRVAVMDAGMEKTIAIVPYGSPSEMTKSLQDAKQAISRFKQSGGSLGTPSTPATARVPAPATPVPSANAPAPAPAPEPAATDAAQKEMRIWQSASGKTLEAALVQDLGAAVVLEKADGSRFQIKKSGLVQEDQDYIAAAASWTQP